MTDTNINPIAPETIERYLQFWNTAPGDEQRQLGHCVFNDFVSYRAPIGEHNGVEALVTLAAEFTEHLGSLTMQARTDPDLHHRDARLQWRLLRNGLPFAEGTDILTFDIDGHVASVATFLDKAPEGFNPHD
jgi:hypothetical protein